MGKSVKKIWDAINAAFLSAGFRSIELTSTKIGFVRRQLISSALPCLAAISPSRLIPESEIEIVEIVMVADEN